MMEAEEGLRLAVLVEVADGKRSCRANLGYAQLNYGRLFIRDFWTLFALAREMECEIGDFLPKEDRSQRRAQWDQLIRASEEVLAVVRSLPAPMKQVTEARSEGLSWRKIRRLFPDRMLFSMQDDFFQSLQIIQARAKESLHYLSTSENFIVVSDLKRA